MGDIFGMDEIENEKKEKATEQTKAKKRPFAYWSGGGKELKLKLSTAQVCKLEEKYCQNLLNLLTGSGGIPPLGIMLTVIQAAAADWNHSIKLKDLQAMFDQYVEEGGTQLTLFTDVIMKILMVSGFFTESQREDMTGKMEEVKSQM